VIERIRAAVAAVPDPELGVLTIGDLGILRDVRQDPTGQVVITITPTYLGCPALDMIRADIAAAAQAAGCSDVHIVTSLSPPWTTDWLSPAAKAKLADAGIAPPLPLVTLSLRCPRCGSHATTELARTAATACRSLWRCTSCHEPFDHLKPH
jgi:ring-1,2-phenylacetyl-CoA epoxidase subunit PaaD